MQVRVTSWPNLDPEAVQKIETDTLPRMRELPGFEGASAALRARKRRSAVAGLLARQRVHAGGVRRRRARAFAARGARARRAFREGLRGRPNPTGRRARAESPPAVANDYGLRLVARTASARAMRTRSTWSAVIAGRTAARPSARRPLRRPGTRPPEPEALAIERQQVDARQVGLRRDPALASAAITASRSAPSGSRTT